MGVDKEFDVPPIKFTLKQKYYAWQQSQAKFVIEYVESIDALFTGLETSLFYNTKQEDEKDTNSTIIDDM